jgi:Predicted membrane protein (DUF2306)
MFVLAERMPLVFRLHMVSGSGALVFTALAYALRTNPPAHRMVGRLGGAFVVVSGFSSFPVAMMSDSTMLARAGFFVQGVVWLGLLACGLRAIRIGQRDLHARLMVAMFAVTTGAIWFRLIIGSAILLDLPFTPIYAAAAWLGWVLPLGAVVYWHGRAARHRRRTLAPSLQSA